MSCWRAGIAAVGAALVLAAADAGAQAPLPVYADFLASGFQDWGWATRDYANTSPVHSGNRSVAVTCGAWGGLQIYHTDFNSAPYSSLSFWLNGGPTGGQRLQVYGLLHVGSTANLGQGLNFSLGTLAPNTWQKFVVPLSSLGVANKLNFTGFVIQERTGAAQPTFYVDDIELVAVPPPALTRLSVNATQEVRTVDSRWFAVNTAIWDANFDTSATVSLLREMGSEVLRFPGGSLSDEYHWSTDTNLTNTWRWVTSFGNFVHIATNVGAEAFITVNYGTGSTNEAAAWVAYANGVATDSRPLGTDPRGTSWQTVGYWASLRATAPLAHDDGRNFLRVSRPAPFGFKFWEIGNECHGDWETDSNVYPHDPYTYAMRASDYWRHMKMVDPAIRVGVVATPGEDSAANGYNAHPALNPRTGKTHNGWTPVLLTTLRGLGITPDFAVHHRYPQWTDKNKPAGADSDALLLQCSTTWAADAADLRQQINDYSGPAGTNTELVVTENNSDAGAQGKQSTSLVNGLYYADSLGQLMQTEFNAFVWWDLRNSTDTGGCFDDILYGWRRYGDLGMINGLTTRHPTFYAAKLMRGFAEPGDRVLKASSDFPLLTVYAARRASGAVSLLVLNKSTSTNLTAAVTIDGFNPSPAASCRSYGIPQDEAARANAPLAAQDIVTNAVSGMAGSFTNTFPALSLTLLSLAPESPRLSVVPAAQAGGQFVIQLQGQSKARYYLQNSTNLSSWVNVSTNTLTGNTLNFTNPSCLGPAGGCWRALWQP